jgi:uncharacterized membrane protein required for colicin V production
MPLISTIIIGCVLTFGLINGFRHGGIKEGIALVGVLLGTLLVEFWVEPWGGRLSERSGLKPENAKWVISLALLVGTALFSGYGSGIFIRRGVIKTKERMGGALLGLLNMGLLVSFTLRYTQQFYFIESNPAQPQASWIRAGALSRYMVDWIGYTLIGAAFAIGAVALITRTMWIAKLMTQQAAVKAEPGKTHAGTATKPSTAGSSTAGKGAAAGTTGKGAAAGGLGNLGGSGGSSGLGGSNGSSSNGNSAAGAAAAQAQRQIPIGQQEKFEMPPQTGKS